jgi:hypothetical protein
MEIAGKKWLTTDIFSSSHIENISFLSLNPSLRGALVNSLWIHLSAGSGYPTDQDTFFHTPSAIKDRWFFTCGSNVSFKEEGSCLRMRPSF